MHKGKQNNEPLLGDPFIFRVAKQEKAYSFAKVFCLSYGELLECVLHLQIMLKSLCLIRVFSMNLVDQKLELLHAKHLVFRDRQGNWGFCISAPQDGFLQDIGNCNLHLGSRIAHVVKRGHSGFLL